jgi:hypothetical protein
VKSLYDAMLDPDLFGRTFGGPTFANWIAVAKVLDGLPLSDDELAFYRKVTDRADAPAKPFTEAYLIKPRRAGGTLFAAAVALHAALDDYRSSLGPGEWATVALIASDRKQARQALNYVKGLVDNSPLIAAEVDAVTQESIAFRHRSRLEVHTTSFRSTRGYSYAAVVLDELAFFRDEVSANPDVELVRAVRPGLANLRGRLLGLSSPHAKRGHLFEMYRQHFGLPSNVLVLKADHTQLNPTIDPAIIERAMAEDPDAARSEWFGEFREDVSQFLPDQLIDAAVVPGRTELPWELPNRGWYMAFCDVSAGVHDAAALAIAHKDWRTEKCILDQILVMTPPFQADEVTARFAALCQRFEIGHLHGDRYAQEWVAAAFRRSALRYEYSPLDKSAIYAEVLPLFIRSASNFWMTESS